MTASEISRRKTVLYVEASAWLLFAVAIWYFSFGFSEEFSTFRWGSALWPRAIATLMVVAVIAHFLTEYGKIRALERGGGQLRSDAGSAGAMASTAGDPGKHAIWKIGLTFLIPVAYVYLLPRTGYFAVTPFFILFMLLIFGVRNIKVLLGVTIGFYAFTVLLFSVILFVALPTGRWLVFHEFSNWLLQVIR